MKRLSRIASVLLAVMLLIVVVAGCSGKSGLNAIGDTAKKAGPVTLNISAAASLRDALGEIKTLYTSEHPDVTLNLNFGGSGTLEQQIEQGAPVDLFISAASKQMDALAKEALLQDDTRKDLLSNRIVLVVPADATAVKDFKDLTTAGVKRIAIGDPSSVPAGTYAQQVFKSLGIADQVKSKLIMANDVTQVLIYVESGNVDAGIVYLSDARASSKVKVVAQAPDAINATVVYPVAVIKGSKNVPAAQNFEEFLSGDQAKAVFEKYGFIVLRAKS